MLFKKSNYLILLLFCLLIRENTLLSQQHYEVDTMDSYLLVLGIAQDAGHPQIDCQKSCCKGLLENQKTAHFVSSIAIIDNHTKEYWVLDATPDFKFQLEYVRKEMRESYHLPNGIFLTHAHTGHYTGLMDLSKEALNSKNIPVYGMPRMKNYLESNGPWSQLVQQGNIKLIELQNNIATELNSRISITPIIVPHRDEYSETVGYLVTGPIKSVLFIPDIDKWEKWERSINEMLQGVDYAFLDATFYDGKELGNRDMRQIPHPSIVETMFRLENERANIKSKVNFIHLNHTNPVLNKNSNECNEVKSLGFNVAFQGQRLKI